MGKNIINYNLTMYQEKGKNKSKKRLGKAQIKKTFFVNCQLVEMSTDCSIARLNGLALRVRRFVRVPFSLSPRIPNGD